MQYYLIAKCSHTLNVSNKINIIRVNFVILPVAAHSPFIKQFYYVLNCPFVLITSLNLMYYMLPCIVFIILQ